MIDADHSGYIDIDELHQLMYLSGCCPTEDEMEQMMAEFDKDGQFNQESRTQSAHTHSYLILWCMSVINKTAYLLQSL